LLQLLFCSYYSFSTKYRSFYEVKGETMTEQGSPDSRKSKVKLPPQVIPRRPVEERIHDFLPVSLGFDESSAVAEAERCLSCPKQPCVTACPLHNDIPTAMRHIAEGQFIEAAAVYRNTSTMPYICSRVCPQENLCEGACVLGKRSQPVALGALERFVTDYARTHTVQATPEHRGASGKSVAVIGTGPAGLSVADRLLKLGHTVTLYEAWPHPGGWLAYATCSLLPRENRGQAEAFLTRHPGWRLQRDHVFTPLQGGDGFYLALLQRS